MFIVVMGFVIFFAETGGQALSISYVYFVSDIDATTTGHIYSIERDYVGGYGSVRYNVLYGYTVNDKEYTGRLISFRGRPTHREIIGNYRPGQVVTVSYDQSNPRFAVLEVSSLGGRVIRPLVIMVCVFLGGVIYLVRPR